MKTKIILISLILMFTTSIQCQEKVLYLYKPPQIPPVSINLTDIRNNPVYIPINCQQRSCAIYKIKEFPCMIYWKGPGSAFQRILPANQQGARAHLLAKQIGAFNRFRLWIENWTQPQTFIYSMCFATFLYTVFTLLFSPPKSQVQQRKMFAAKNRSKKQ